MVWWQCCGCVVAVLLLCSGTGGDNGSGVLVMLWYERCNFVEVVAVVL